MRRRCRAGFCKTAGQRHLLEMAGLHARCFCGLATPFRRPIAAENCTFVPRFRKLCDRNPAGAPCRGCAGSDGRALRLVGRGGGRLLVPTPCRRGRRCVGPCACRLGRRACGPGRPCAFFPELWHKSRVLRRKRIRARGQTRRRRRVGFCKTAGQKHPFEMVGRALVVFAALRRRFDGR